MQKWREDNQLWRAQQESRLEYCGTQIQHLQAQGDARWAEEQAPTTVLELHIPQLAGSGDLRLGRIFLRKWRRTLVPYKLPNVVTSVSTCESDGIVGCSLESLG
ncbi:uncharacterized protein LOC121757029 [Salvia splendens]|uniref:uncharacterized protein LOC121757029 n=1 Tax=Salvia splendens TaxID=180675 RepID=UPI001C27CFDB|nr:uncharacterized protein LOC121757029 [Salvia splendens]